MEKQIEKTPISDRVLDIVLDPVIEIDLAEIQTKKKRTRTIFTNGSSPPTINTNGSRKDFYDAKRFYRVGNRVYDISKISYEDIITEDDEPVDNFPSEKQQRLLVNPLYSSNYFKSSFVAAANVGLHYEPGVPAIVPDMFLSLGTSTVHGDEIWDKENRTYYVWKMGKPPELVLEIVSNRKGNETDGKFDKYARVGAKYYVVLDHLKQAQDEILKVYELVDGRYEERDDYLLPELNLSLTFWEGQFEKMNWSWLRLCDLEGTMIPTSDERADQEKELAVEQKRIARQATAHAAEQEHIAQEQERIAQEEAARAAEQERIAQEQAARAVEQERIAQEETARAAEQERIAQEETARAAEQERIAQEEAARAAEQERIAQEQTARAVEQERIAQEEAARAAEQERRANEEAARAAQAEAENARLRALLAQLSNGTDKDNLP